MRRLVDHWWLVTAAMVAAVLVLTLVFYRTENDRRRDQQATGERQALTVLSGAVDDALLRENALARVVGSLTEPIRPQWPALAGTVTSEPVATGAGFIRPVTQAQLPAFTQQTGLRPLDAPTPGQFRPAPPRSLHLLLSAYAQKAPGGPPLGLDLAGNSVRRDLLLQAARTGQPVASPPIQFLARLVSNFGVVVYAPVRLPGGQLKGWVSASYDSRVLASTVSSHLPGVRLTIRDGSSYLVGGPGRPAGAFSVLPVAGRQWSVWAAVPAGRLSAVPWLVLGFGLALTAAVGAMLRLAARHERQAFQVLARRDAEEAALGQIATLVAQGATPEAVFASVAEQIGRLFAARCGVVSRFDPESMKGIVLGGWAQDGQDLLGAEFALDGLTASAEVFRTGHAARTQVPYPQSTDSIAPLIDSLGGRAGAAAPIVVAGRPWGALATAYRDTVIPAGVEGRLERFARLVGLAVSNADAWDKLARQASTDPLTGVANRRTFYDRLTSELARAERYHRSLSLVLLDLDHFKAINDLHGHQVGDRVLVLFAQLLSSHAREGELVGRLGGEEFGWLMPEADRRGAYVAAERVRQAVQEEPLEGVNVTVSSGVCSADDARDAHALVRDADRALYCAKEGGRNMTFFYVDETPVEAAETEPAEAGSPPADAGNGGGPDASAAMRRPSAG